jgi:MFS family permease
VNFTLFSPNNMLAALCISVTVSFGILWYAFTVVQTPMQLELGWNSAEITAGASLAILVSGGLAAWMGRWFDAHGTRIPMSIGSLVAALGVLGWSLATTQAFYWFAWMLIGAGRGLVVYEAAFHAINQHFLDRRRALTILTFAGGFASVIFIPLINVLLQQMSWREVVALLAALELLTLPLHWLFMPNSPAQLRETISSTPLEMLRSPTFNILTNAFALMTVSGITLNLQAIPILLEKGYAAGFAASIGALIGLMGLPGRLIFTPLGARIGGFRTLAILIVCHALGALALLLPTSWSAYAFLILYGVGFGAIAPNRSALLVECFGARHYGRINGTMTTRNLVFQAGAPLAAGLIHTWFDSYQPVLVLLCLCSFAASGLLLICPPFVPGLGEVIPETSPTIITT